LLLLTFSVSYEKQKKKQILEKPTLMRFYIYNN